jgi:hypothetical protein
VLLCCAQLTAQYTPVGAGVEAAGVTRVLTHRLRCTDTAAGYVASTHGGTAAAVAAKLVVLRLSGATSHAPSPRAEHTARQHAHQQVHARLTSVAKMFGQPPPHRRELRSLPPELAPLAEGLYQVRPPSSTSA